MTYRSCWLQFRKEAADFSSWRTEAVDFSSWRTEAVASVLAQAIVYRRYIDTSLSWVDGAAVAFFDMLKPVFLFLLLICRCVGLWTLSDDVNEATQDDQRSRQVQSHVFHELCPLLSIRVSGRVVLVLGTYLSHRETNTNWMFSLLA